jgi:hypothetical protein
MRIKVSRFRHVCNNPQDKDSDLSVHEPAPSKSKVIPLQA